MTYSTTANKKPFSSQTCPSFAVKKSHSSRRKPSPAGSNKRHSNPRRRYLNKNNNSKRATRRETSAGGVVARKDKHNWLIALLKTTHKSGPVWVLPKGHIEPSNGETAALAAQREVQEETGLKDLSVKEQVGITRYSFQAENTLVKKTVHYFLILTNQKKLIPQQEEGLIDACWQPINRAVKMLAYDTDKDMVAKAKQRLTGKTNPPSNSHRPRRRLRIHT